MVNAILTPFESEGTFTITVASLANGAGRSSAKITNSGEFPAAIITVKLTSGTTAPTLNRTYKVYLLRDAGTLATDGWGGTDAAFTPENAKVIGQIKVTATASKAFYIDIDTSDFGPLGPEWGIAIYNDSGQALHSTAGNHSAHYRYYYPEVQ
jgi:hypothetical protein